MMVQKLLSAHTKLTYSFNITCKKKKNCQLRPVPSCVIAKTPGEEHLKAKWWWPKFSKVMSQPLAMEYSESVEHSLDSHTGAKLHGRNLCKKFTSRAKLIRATIVTGRTVYTFKYRVKWISCQISHCIKK